MFYETPFAVLMHRTHEGFKNIVRVVSFNILSGYY